ncbi:MAG TPA: serine/threonine-protein kinase [Polyangiaceae bacterium]|nr:serine/threonine-protein kinase [Polyangiaceae bacterium]
MSGRRVGRYLMQDRIAVGGMASVHIGRILGPAGFSRLVAIKRMHEHLSDDPDFTTMFLDEARLTASVQHPNVVSTIDVVTDQGDLFLVMDYVLGDSLANLMKEAHRLGEDIPLPIASSIMTGVLNGLHAAHEACNDRGEPMAIVHRDVSPQNILVGADGIARIADFGVAKAASRMHSTQDGKVKGKLAYMAPEQLQRGEIDRRTDVYAAGVVLWELTTSKRLFTGDDPASIISAVLRGSQTPPSAHRTDVPSVLDAVVTRALAMSPAARYATALEFVANLEIAVPPASPREVAAWVAAVAGPKLAERRKLMVDMPTATVDWPVTAPATPAVKQRASRGIWIGGVAVLLLGVLALASSLAFSRRRADPPNPVTSTSAVAIASQAATPPTDTAPAQDPTAEAPAPAPSSRARPNRGSRAAVAPPPQPPPASTCNPPFTIDGNGVKRFKPDCF